MLESKPYQLIRPTVMAAAVSGHPQGLRPSALGSATGLVRPTVHQNCEIHLYVHTTESY
jgi:hypothetical protein